MLMGNAAKILQTVAANIDRDVIEPLVGELYDMIMLTDKTGILRGDENIHVLGVNVAIQRETQRQRQLEFLQITANPIDMQITGVKGRASVLRSVSEGLGLNGEDVVPPDDVLAAQQSAPPGGPPGGGASRSGWSDPLQADPQGVDLRPPVAHLNKHYPVRRGTRLLRPPRSKGLQRTRWEMAKVTSKSAREVRRQGRGHPVGWPASRRVGTQKPGVTEVAWLGRRQVVRAPRSRPAATARSAASRVGVKPVKPGQTGVR